MVFSFLEDWILHPDFQNPVHSVLCLPALVNIVVAVKLQHGVSAGWLLQFWHSAMQKALVDRGNSFLTPSRTLSCWKFFTGYCFPLLKLYKWITNTKQTLLMHLSKSPVRNHFIFRSLDSKKSYKLTTHRQAFREACGTTMSPYLCSWGWSF